MSNALNRFHKIINKPTRTIARVIQVNPNDTTVVQFSDASQSVVLGSADQSAVNVYVTDGRVVGTAADLPFSELEV